MCAPKAGEHKVRPYEKHMFDGELVLSFNLLIFQVFLTENRKRYYEAGRGGNPDTLPSYTQPGAAVPHFPPPPRTLPARPRRLFQRSK